MNENEIFEFPESIFITDIPIDEIPSIDLYMDQVISLFETNLSSSKRNVEDAILTKTMINNYSKNKLLMSSNKKKYSKDHIILMILIYNLKQILSITDIKKLLNPLVTDYENNTKIFDIQKIYTDFLFMKNKYILSNEVDFNSMKEEIKTLYEDHTEHTFLVKLLYILLTSSLSIRYKRTSEFLIDNNKINCFVILFSITKQFIYFNIKLYHFFDMSVKYISISLLILLYIFYSMLMMDLFLILMLI